MIAVTFTFIGGAFEVYDYSAIASAKFVGTRFATQRIQNIRHIIFQNTMFEDCEFDRPMDDIYPICAKCVFVKDGKEFLMENWHEVVELKSAFPITGEHRE